MINPHLRAFLVDCDNRSLIRRDPTNLEHRLNKLETVEELNRALVESTNRPVLLFKHSLTCPLSTRALRELHTFLEHADSRIIYGLITVQTARDVSDEASFKLGLIHESPQAILIRNGSEVWNASHSDITASALERAISEAFGSEGESTH